MWEENLVGLMKKYARVSVLVAMVIVLVASACGGGSSEDATEPAAAAPTSAPQTDSGDESPAETEPTPEPEVSSGTFEPGSTEFRAVNLLDVPVDIYVRTTGLVEAFAIEENVAPGAVTEFVAPPEGGRYIVTGAGAGDPTCVSGCDHFIGELSAFEENGSVYTVVLYNDEFSGPRALDLWEQPVGDRTGTTNAMVPGQTLSAIAVVTAVAVTDADFGLRISSDLSSGCLEPINFENGLIGGNQTPAYLLDMAGSFSLHDSQDRECAEPSDGPFTFAAGPGSRTHIFLTGAPGSIEAIQVPMTAGELVEVATTTEDRDAVVALMADELVVNFGLPDDQASCAGGLIVDAVGTDILYDGSALVDLDGLPDATSDLAAEALINSVEICGIDPALFIG